MKPLLTWSAAAWCSRARRSQSSSSDALASGRSPLILCERHDGARRGSTQHLSALCLGVDGRALLVAHQVRRLGRDEQVGAPQRFVQVVGGRTYPGRRSARSARGTHSSHPRPSERHRRPFVLRATPGPSAGESNTVSGGPNECSRRRNRSDSSNSRRSRCAGEHKRAARVGAGAVLENVSGGAPARFGEVGSRRTARCWGERRGSRRGRPDDRGLPRGAVCRLGTPRTDRSLSDPRVVRRPVAWSGLATGRRRSRIGHAPSVRGVPSRQTAHASDPCASGRPLRHSRAAHPNTERSLGSRSRLTAPVRPE